MSASDTLITAILPLIIAMLVILMTFKLTSSGGGMMGAMMGIIVGVIAFVVSNAILNNVINNQDVNQTTDSNNIQQSIPSTPISIPVLPIIIVISSIAFLVISILIIKAIVKYNKNHVKEIKIRVEKNSKKFVSEIEELSKEHKNYLNNIGELLNLEIVDGGIWITKNYGLYLSSDNKRLHVDNHYDWYITDKIIDKYPESCSFKVVGLHKEDKSKNVGYVISKDNSGKVSLLQVPQEYISGKINNSVAPMVMGMISSVIATSLINSIGTMYKDK
jgi:lipopolysaccharide export LptBFGC system permease protein LptF